MKLKGSFWAFVPTLIFIGLFWQSHAAANPAYEAAVLADNPVAYWRLNETSGTDADNLGALGAAVDGTYQNGVVLGAIGAVVGDFAADFDGTNDLVRIPDNNAINTSTHAARTIELWFNADNVTNRQVLYEEGGGTHGLNIYIEAGQVHAGYWVSANGAWASTAININTNYHIALVYDGGANTVTGYLNGVAFGPSSRTPAVANVPAHTGDIGIGAINQTTLYPNGDSPGSGEAFGGLIDEVAIYNSVLTQPQLQAHINEFNNNNNNAPINNVPGAQTTLQNTNILFSGTNQISVSDIDAMGNSLEIMLSATNGTISLSGTTNLMFTQGDGMNDATMTFTGALPDINAALNNLTYSPTMGYTGPTMMTLASNDQGNSGMGGAMSDTDVINITVNTLPPPA
ncbi:MAG: LamG domain-containing protein, partial [Pseudomonadota bacterium]